MAYQWKAYWVDLEPTKGSEQAGNRPAIVISSEEVNQSLPIVAIIPLTTARDNRRVYPTEAYLPSDKTGLPQDSIAMAHQIRTISKKRINLECGFVFDEGLRKEIRVALKTYLDL